MCGIAGLLHLDGAPVEASRLQAMTDTLAHRGPDGQGIWLEGSVGLGHRRLSIIDLSEAASQPMVSLEHRYFLTYNGELYNYRELRRELQDAGYWFRSDSDTEVVLNAFIAWGHQCLDRFNGMFAFAVWDRCTRTLTLARDRFGIKPLYWSRRGHTFAFASEQKAILQDPGFARKINKTALLEYFTFQNLFTTQTLQEDIELLPAGHYATLCLDARHPELQLKAYWDYDFREPEKPLRREEYLEELDRLFQQAVQRQLVGDVELGAYLSGGMDSGSITAIAAQQFPFLKSFTCGFDLSTASGIELAFDERPRAEAMSGHFKTEHYEMVLKAGDMERCLSRLAYSLEEPRVGQSYPNFYAAQLASKFVKIVLAGTGGDELFGGYPWRYYRSLGGLGFEAYIDEYYAYWQRLLGSQEAAQVFAPIWQDVQAIDTREIFRNVFRDKKSAPHAPEDYINRSLYFEAKTFLHGLFIIEDKLSMAHGLETRVPFMDNDLVDFAMQCPVQLKINNLQEVVRLNENDPGNKISRYFQRTNDGKQLLREAMSRHIPEDIVKAEKQGFSAPDASWFRGESIDFVRQTLIDSDARLYAYLDRKAIGKLLQEHLNGQRNRRLLIWSLLNFEAYLKHFG